MKSLDRSSVFPQTAAAIKVLLFNLPFIIADEVPEDDENCMNYLILLQIVILSLTPITAAHTADVLEYLVAKHNFNNVRLYYELAVTPKVHYMVHLPDQMRLFGSLPSLVHAV